MLVTTWDRSSFPPSILLVADKFYGCDLVAKEVAGKCTIGYDSDVMPNGDKVVAGATITQGEADGMYSATLAPSVALVGGEATWPLNFVQAGALILFVEMNQPKNFGESALMRFLNMGQLNLAALQMLAAPDETLLRQNEYLRKLFVGEAKDSADAYAFVKATSMDWLEAKRNVSLSHGESLEKQKAADTYTPAPKKEEPAPTKAPEPAPAAPVQPPAPESPPQKVTADTTVVEPKKE